MLAEAVKRYQNGLIDSAKIIEELIQLAKDIRAADQRGEKMNLRRMNWLFMMPWPTIQPLKLSWTTRS